MATRFLIDSLKDLAAHPDEPRQLLALQEAAGKKWSYEEAVETLTNAEKWGIFHITN